MAEPNRGFFKAATEFIEMVTMEEKMINRFFAFAAEAERGGGAGSLEQERPEP